MLKRILGQAARARRVRRNLPIYVDEYGFQTNPPDVEFGVPLDKQALYINEADYVAWLDPRIAGVAQYLLADDATLAGFKSGLAFADGRPKPALSAYVLPLLVIRAGGRTTVWGQVRPRGAGATVQIQNDAGGAFAPVQTVTTGPRGYFRVGVANLPGRWRLVWSPAPGQLLFSREAVAGSPPRFTTR